MFITLRDQTLAFDVKRKVGYLRSKVRKERGATARLHGNNLTAFRLAKALGMGLGFRFWGGIYRGGLLGHQSRV